MRLTASPACCVINVTFHYSLFFGKVNPMKARNLLSDLDPGLVIDEHRGVRGGDVVCARPEFRTFGQRADAAFQIFMFPVVYFKG